MRAAELVGRLPDLTIKVPGSPVGDRSGHQRCARDDRGSDFATGAVPQESLAALTDAWSPSPAGATINWTRLRAFLDALHAHRDRLGTAIATPPVRSGNDQLDNLLSAIAEKLADDAHTTRPRWCAAVHPLPVPWEPPGTPRMKASARRSAPTQFKARNIWLAEHDLWRDRG
jgi:hypothetical protein